MLPSCCMSLFFFFNDTATTEIYTLSLHDALPISVFTVYPCSNFLHNGLPVLLGRTTGRPLRSEEHTSELQSHLNLVCRLLLEKKKQCPNRRPLRICFPSTASGSKRRLPPAHHYRE